MVRSFVTGVVAALVLVALAGLGAVFGGAVNRARRLPAGDGHAHRHGRGGGDSPDRAPVAGSAPGGHDHHEGGPSHAH